MSDGPSPVEQAEIDQKKPDTRWKRIGTKLPIDVSASRPEQESQTLPEPPIEEGMTRLYRGEGDSPIAKAGINLGEDVGRYFTDLKEVARIYGPDIYYIDLPPEEAEPYLSNASREHLAKTGEKMPHFGMYRANEYLLPEKFQEEAKSLKNEPKPESAKPVPTEQLEHQGSKS